MELEESTYLTSDYTTNILYTNIQTILQMTTVIKTI